MAYVPSSGGGLTSFIEVSTFAALITALALPAQKTILMAAGTYEATEDVVIGSDTHIIFQGEVILDLKDTYKLRTTVSRDDGMYNYRGISWDSGSSTFRVSNAGPVELWDGYVDVGTIMFQYDRSYVITGHGNDGTYDWVTVSDDPNVPPPAGLGFSMVNDPVTNVILEGHLVLTETAGRTGETNQLIEFYGMQSCNMEDLLITRQNVSSDMHFIIFYTGCHDCKLPQEYHQDTALLGMPTGALLCPTFYHYCTVCHASYSAANTYHTGTTGGVTINFVDARARCCYFFTLNVKVSGTYCDVTGSSLTVIAVYLTFCEDMIVIGPINGTTGTGASDISWGSCARYQYLG